MNECQSNPKSAADKPFYSFSSVRFLYHCITEQDTDTLVMWRSRPDVIRYFRSPIPITRESHLQWYQEQYLTDKNRYDFIVRDVEEPVGFVALIREDSQSATAEINPNYRGFHYGKELICGIVRFGYEMFGITRFTAIVHRDNIPSQKAAVSSGFRLKDNSGDFWTYVRSV